MREQPLAEDGGLRHPCAPQKHLRGAIPGSIASAGAAPDPPATTPILAPDPVLFGCAKTTATFPPSFTRALFLRQWPYSPDTTAKMVKVRPRSGSVLDEVGETPAFTTGNDCDVQMPLWWTPGCRSLRLHTLLAECLARRARRTTHPVPSLRPTVHYGRGKLALRIGVACMSRHCHAVYGSPQAVVGPRHRRASWPPLKTAHSPHLHRSVP